MEIVELSSTPKSVQSATRTVPRDLFVSYNHIKRLGDILVSGIALLILSPLLVFIAILIKLDSPGPVFFMQRRGGSRMRRLGAGREKWDVVPFEIFKFRTMAHNADSNAGFKLANDKRITRLGTFLRRTSLDELPQLLNILRGEMSLVGPRPVPLYEVEEYADWHHERFCAPPGLTGWWQVKGRGRATFEESIKLDIEYVRNRSFWMDVKVLLLTVPAVFVGKGAK
jgi:lipopolysaccharide/colanic/teichoic acid biosynthesis glycosyltransferase